MPLLRKAGLKGAAMKRGGKPMKRTAKLAPRGETKRKKEARYKAYLSSPAWKAKRREALESAGHRCQYEDGYWWDGRAMQGGRFRCPETTRLHVHHLTYARFGNEALSDLQVLCRAHHDLIERTQHPTRTRGAA